MIHTAAHEALSSHVWCLREQIARDRILASEGSQQFAASTEENVPREQAGPPMNFKAMSPFPPTFLVQHACQSVSQNEEN